MIIEFKFAPLEEFEWWRELKDENGSIVERSMIGHYLPGMTYNCTKKPVHDALREKCVQWEKEGKIQILALPQGQSFKTIQVGN
jgi:hypothetical protein